VYKPSVVNPTGEKNGKVLANDGDSSFKKAVGNPGPMGKRGKKGKRTNSPFKGR